MKKTLAAMLVLCITLCVPFTSFATAEEGEASAEHLETTEYPNDPSLKPDLVADAAIIMDAKTGQVLFEKNAHAKKYPASTTKILTTALALEKVTDLNEQITISENAVWDIDRNSTLIGLDVGEKITIGDCLYAAMVKSDNTCAYALAEYVSGDVKTFANVMNKKAKDLGCEDTHFVTPNGLHDDDHYTSAYDMALITKYALQNDTFRQLAGTLFYEVPATNLTDDTRPIWNGNRMINPREPSYYEYCEGGKTGYTTDANNTLVTFARKDGLELICVIFDCDGWKYTYTDSRALYNYCYNNYFYYFPLSDFSFETDDPDSKNANSILQNYYNSLDHALMALSVDKNFSLLVNRYLDTTQIKKEIHLFDKAKDNNILGEITFYYEDEIIGTTPIRSSTPILSSVPEEIPEAPPSVLDRVKKAAFIIFTIAAVLVVILFIIRLFGEARRKIKRRRENRSKYRYRRAKRRRRDDDYFF